MNVIIVDDTPFDLHQMVRLVESIDGTHPHGFLKTSDALGWCQEAKADLVIVDYLMPGADGFDFVRRLRADPQHAEVPIMLITGFEEPRARHHAEELGIKDVFTKPVDAARFVQRTRTLLTGVEPPVVPAPQSLAPGRSAAPALSQYAMEQEVSNRLYCVLRMRDPASGVRGSRVAHYGRLIGAALGLARADQQTLFRAAPLADIGKIALSDAVLFKEGRLTLEEYEGVKRHALDGYLLLRDSPLPLLKAAADIALTHHEKWDGTGYPRGLRQKAIPLFGRVVAIADVFSAVTTQRPYGEAWALEEGREYIRRASGIHFDPVCVEAFLESWDQLLGIQDYFGADAVPGSVSLVS
jgi:putative two-component system response regulator